MALKFMRDQAKSFWVKVLLYTVALSFIIGFGAFTYLGQGVPGKDPGSVGR